MGTEVDWPRQLLAPGLGALAELDLDAARQDYIEALPVAAAILCRDATGVVHVDLVNEPFLKATGWGGGEGRNRIGEIEFFTATSIAQTLEDFFRCGERAYQLDIRDGRGVNERYYTVRMARLRPTADSRPRCLISLLDRTLQVATEKSLRAEMLRDSLSGLPNRLAFNERIEALLCGGAYRSDTYAVLVIDMDRFSRVNECVGALAGDELLITFARRLFSVLRPGDVLSRTGGDEFAILLRLDNGIPDALEIADCITGLLLTPFRLVETEICIDCSIGCALLSGKEETAEEVLRNAQFALKRSKSSGRVEVFDPEQARAARRRFGIETDLRRALEADKLRLAFQPLIRLGTGEVAGFEALARWDDPALGQVAPDEFIAVAEESGLIVALGRWILEAALATLADWDRQTGRRLPFHLGVNLSAVQLRRDSVEEFVSEGLRRHGIDGSRLMLELTESAIVHDFARAAEVLTAMKKLDVRIAVDDFGTGYTSLAYLQRLPIDMLKIDGSLVTDMLEDADGAAIVKAVLSLADALGLSTTAEGIEHPDLPGVLRGLGCTNGQGFVFSEPLEPAAALDYWLSRKA